MKIQTMYVRVVTGLILAALTMAAIGCSPTNKQDEASNNRRDKKYGETLTYRVATPPQTLNYLTAADDSTLLIAFYLTGGRLVEFDHKHNQYVLSLAETLQKSSNGKDIDIILRSDIKFSDGKPITAHDVAFTIQALYDPKTVSPIFGGAMIVNGKQIEASVINERCIRWSFPEPVAAPEGYISNLVILPKHILESELKNGKINSAYTLTTDPSRIVTSGPFAVKSINAGDRITLQPNQYYWKKDKENKKLPYLDELIVKVSSDANNAFMGFEKGYIDLYDRLRPSDFATLKKLPASYTQESHNPEHAAVGISVKDVGPGLDPDYFWFNLNDGKKNGKPLVDPIKRSWFSSVNFRRALSYAIDRDTLAAVTLQGLATSLYSIVTPANKAWVSNSIQKTPFDIETARKLLREAGFTTKQTGSSSNKPMLYDSKGNKVEFTLLVPVESQLRIRLATVVQDEALKLGISIKVAPVEIGELQNRVFRTFEYDAVLQGAVISEPDPSSYYNLLYSKSPSRPWYPNQTSPLSKWEAKLDQLLNAQASESNPERRKRLFSGIQNILSEQMPIIPLVARHRLSAAKRSVGNFDPSPMIPYSLWNAETLYLIK